MNAMLTASALALAAAIRDRSVDPRQLVEGHIDRLRQINPGLNALVANRFTAARAEAEAAQRRLRGRRRRLPPLLGVPCTIKECYAVAGMPNSGGLMARAEVVADADALAVRRLRRAGAIVLGVSNVPEGGMWMETYNRLHGRTNNPWNLQRTAGGSSGGEAALVAAGGSAFGLGSDLGGSIRIPAAFCGVVGHKPSGGLVPNQGCWPQLQGARAAYLCTGPITRRVGDVLPLLQILSGAARPPPEPPELRQVVVYMPPLDAADGDTQLWPAIRTGLQQAAAALQDRGMRLRVHRLPPCWQLAMMWSAMLSSTEGGGDGAAFARVLGNGRPLALGRELVRLGLGRSSHTPVALAVSLVERLLEQLPRRTLAGWCRCALALRQELEALLGNRGVLLCPPYSRPAPRHRLPLLTPLDFSHAAIFNVLQLPATQVPVGFDAEGLPLGVQVVARRGGDALTLAVAEVLEQALGGWQLAPPLRSVAGLGLAC